MLAFDRNPKQTFQLMDCVRLLQTRSIEDLVRLVHGAADAEGVIGDAARGAVSKALRPLTASAVSRLHAILPDDLKAVYTARVLSGGVFWIEFDYGFLCISADDARLGTAAEWECILRIAAPRVAGSSEAIHPFLSHSNFRVVN